jgi:DNA-binding LacI/PurR family transcriptional regulator
VIAGVFGPSEVDTSVRRRQGFVSAAEQFKLSPIVVDCSGLSARDGYTETREILRKHPTVTAIFASTLLMGIGALRAAGDEQRPVPGSLSVICLHDSHLADFFLPSLSTIRMPIEELGIAAVGLLIDLYAGGPNREIMIAGEGEIIERESTGPAPSFSEMAPVLKGS